MPHVVEIIVPPGKKKERLDVYITGHVENATRNKVQQAIRGGTVLVNGDRVRPSYAVMPDDVIQITFPGPPRPKRFPKTYRWRSSSRTTTSSSSTSPRGW